MSSTTEVGAQLQHATMVLLKDVLCVKQGESVLITMDTDADPLVAKAVQIASHLLGAKAVQLLMDPPLPLQGLLADPFIPEPVLAAVQHADLWFDLTMPYMAGSKAFDMVMHAGRGRYFLAGGLQADTVIRMYGKIDVDALFRVTDAFQEVFDKTAGKEVRITSPSGTDVTFNTLAIPRMDAFQLAKATKPGGYFAPGAAAFIPLGPTVKGVIAIDAVLHDYYTLLDEPMFLEMDGNIQSVRGGGTEQRAMERALRRAGNGGYGGIVHFSCGTHSGARLMGKNFHEDTRVIGTNAVGFGFPPGTPGGGENHPDGVIIDQSIWIEGELIVDKGIICAPADVAQGIRDLEPIYA